MTIRAALWRCPARRVRQNGRVPKVLRAVGTSVTVVLLGALGADVGTAIYAEYHLSRSVRSAAGLTFDPWVAILGFPFLP